MDNKNILEVIKTRQSARFPFDPNRVPSKEEVNQVLEAARWAPTPHNMQNFEIIILDDKKLLETIGNLKSTLSEDFVKENFLQLSFSEEEFRKKKVGLLGTMFPPALRKPTLPPGEIITSTIGQFLQSCPLLLIILYDPTTRAPASKGDLFGIMGLGCVMENMWLMAESLGIAFHVITALNHDPVASEVKTLLNIPTKLQIVFSVRLGYSIPSPFKYLRVRRDKEDFVYHNGYKKNKLESFSRLIQ